MKKPSRIFAIWVLLSCLFGSITALSAPLSEEVKGKYLERIKKFVDVDLIEVEVKAHYERTAAKRGSELALGKLGQVATISGKPAQSYLYSLEYTIFVSDRLPAEADQSLKSIAQIVGDSFKPQIVKVNYHRIPAVPVPTPEPPPFEWTSFITQNQFLIVVSIIGFVLTGFLVVFFYGLLAFKAYLKQSAERKSPLFGQLKDYFSGEQERAPKRFVNKNVFESVKTSPKPHRRLMLKLQRSTDQILELGIAKEDQAYREIAAQGKYKVLELVAMHCLPAQLFYRLPPHLISHYLGKLDSGDRFNFVASVTPELQEPLLLAFGDPGSPEREVVLFELKRLKGQVDETGAAKTWMQLIDKLREDVRREAPIREQVLPVVESWVKELKTSWKWRSYEKAG